jgi:hypothetical protein
MVHMIGIVEINSAMGYDDRQKVSLYQFEQQYNSERAGGSPVRQRKEGVRPVSCLDYNELRKLEEKNANLKIKKELYERKKDKDET